MVDFLVWMLKGGREGGTQLDRGDGAGGGRRAYLEEEGRGTQSVPSSRMDFPGGQRGGKFGGQRVSLRKAQGHEGSLKQNFHRNPRLRAPPAQALSDKTTETSKQDGRGP